jgi:tRNASer (uridine44-2'-O)-methyltransferase
MALSSSEKFTFSEIVKLFTPETLKLMKNECGGIQTLLKNQKQLFVIRSGLIRLRNWKMNSEDDWNPNPALYKTNICGFIKFHPKGTG